MGVIRSVPQNEINTWTNDQQNHYSVTASCCGWQHYMEDYSVSQQNLSKFMYAVIDGHNGPEVARFCQQKLPHLFRENELIKLGSLKSGVESMIAELDALVAVSQKELNQIRVEEGLPSLPQGEVTRSGCSFALVLFSDEEILIANVGQCRCYVVYESDKTRTVLFSGNHTLSNKDEENRVIKGQNFAFNGRVNGIYPYTRSIGDLHLRDKETGYSVLSSEPSIFCLRLEDVFQIILGTSGVWERPEEVSSSLHTMGKTCKDDINKLQTMLSDLIAKQPTQDALGLGNMLVTMIRLKH